MNRRHAPHVGSGRESGALVVQDPPRRAAAVLRPRGPAATGKSSPPRARARSRSSRARDKAGAYSRTVGAGEPGPDWPRQRFSERRRGTCARRRKLRAFGAAAPGGDCWARAESGARENRRAEAPWLPQQRRPFAPSDSCAGGREGARRSSTANVVTGDRPRRHADTGGPFRGPQYSGRGGARVFGTPHRGSTTLDRGAASVSQTPGAMEASSKSCARPLARGLSRGGCTDWVRAPWDGGSHGLSTVLVSGSRPSHFPSPRDPCRRRYRAPFSPPSEQSVHPEDGPGWSRGGRSGAPWESQDGQWIV